VLQLSHAVEARQAECARAERAERDIDSLVLACRAARDAELKWRVELEGTRKALEAAAAERAQQASEDTCD
jgi:hypothetical protein